MTDPNPGSSGTRPQADEFAVVERQAEAARKHLADAKAREASDRSLIGKVVVGGFGLSVFAVLGIDVLAGYQTGNWAGTMANAQDLIKSVVLPVVTLVLGYYFGRSGKD